MHRVIDRDLQPIERLRERHPNVIGVVISISDQSKHSRPAARLGEHVGNYASRSESRGSSQKITSRNVAECRHRFSSESLAKSLLAAEACVNRSIQNTRNPTPTGKLSK